MDAERDILDEYATPYPFYESPLADHFAGVLNESKQDVEGTTAQLDAFSGSLQKALGRKQIEGSEGDELLGGITSFRLQGSHDPSLVLVAIGSLND